ncbi:MAG: DUF2254 domain-containing protein [Mameliella sp.]|nr:DUF2254 domain-containing protein [Mameliella sp.]
MNRSAIVSGSALKILRFARSLWIRVALISVLALIASGLAMTFESLLPDALRQRFAPGAVLPVLKILASGMLAVSTFSLNVMVTAHHAAAAQATPRAHRILLNDTVTHTALATFIGAFVFALSSIILYRAGYYSDSASVIVFAVTVFVVAAIVVSLVRWIGQLSRIGSLEYALLRAEQTAREILYQQRRLPRLGGCKLEERPTDGVDIEAPRSGFLRRIDMDELQKLAETHEAEVYLDHLPGDIVLRSQRLGLLRGCDEAEKFAACFLLATDRTYEQDPAYALQALRESASKALSPGINDPKTAIDVIARLERLLWDWALNTSDTEGPLYDRVFLSELGAGDLVEAGFRDITRDAAGFGDVLTAVAEALVRLRGAMPEAGREAISDLLEDLRAHGEAGLMTARERQRLTDRLAALDA